MCHELLVSVQDGNVEVCIMVASETGKSDKRNETIGQTTIQYEHAVR